MTQEAQLYQNLVIIPEVKSTLKHIQHVHIVVSEWWLERIRCWIKRVFIPFSKNSSLHLLIFICLLTLCIHPLKRGIMFSFSFLFLIVTPRRINIQFCRLSSEEIFLNPAPSISLIWHFSFSLMPLFPDTWTKVI